MSAPGERPTVEEISDDERALIEEHNAYDIELYRFGAELFEEVAAAAGESLAAAVEKLRQANRAAAEDYKATVAGIRTWVDGELAPGSTAPIADVLAKSDAEGFPRQAFNEARHTLLVRKEQGDDGMWVLIRPSASELEALREARDWLEPELPPGATLPAAPLFERAEAAGVPRVALNQARRLMEVVKATDVNGELTWTRPDDYAR